MNGSEESGARPAGARRMTTVAALTAMVSAVAGFWQWWQANPAEPIGGGAHVPMAPHTALLVLVASAALVLEGDLIPKSWTEKVGKKAGMAVATMRGLGP